MYICWLTCSFIILLMHFWIFRLIFVFSEFFIYFSFGGWCSTQLKANCRIRLHVCTYVYTYKHICVYDVLIYIILCKCISLHWTNFISLCSWWSVGEGCWSPCQCRFPEKNNHANHVREFKNRLSSICVMSTCRMSIISHCHWEAGVIRRSQWWHSSLIWRDSMANISRFLPQVQLVACIDTFNDVHFATLSIHFKVVN